MGCAAPITLMWTGVTGVFIEAALSLSYPVLFSDDISFTLPSSEDRLILVTSYSKQFKSHEQTLSQLINVKLNKCKYLN